MEQEVPTTHELICRIEDAIEKSVDGMAGKRLTYKGLIQ